MQGAQDSDSDSDSDTEPYHHITDHDVAWTQVRRMYERTGNCPKALIRRLQTLADEHDRNVVERIAKESEDRRRVEVPEGSEPRLVRRISRRPDGTEEVHTFRVTDQGTLELLRHTWEDSGKGKGSGKAGKGKGSGTTIADAETHTAASSSSVETVSYTHLTLPTICSV